ncbi:MAG: hypothetical protein ACI33S_02945 [Bacilli bacterium]
MLDNIQEILTTIISKYNLLKSFGYTNEEIEKEIDGFKSKAELYSFSTNNIVTGKRKRIQKKEYMKFIHLLNASLKKINNLLNKLSINTNMPKYITASTSDILDKEVAKQLIEKLFYDLNELIIFNNNIIENKELLNVLYSFIKIEYRLYNTSILDSLRKTMLIDNNYFNSLIDKDFDAICKNKPEYDYSKLRNNDSLNMYIVSFLSDNYLENIKLDLSNIYCNYTTTKKANTSLNHKINAVIKPKTSEEKQKIKEFIKSKELMIFFYSLLIGLTSFSIALGWAKNPKYIYNAQIAQYSTKTNIEETINTYSNQNAGDIIYTVYDGDEIITYFTHNDKITTINDAYNYVHENNPKLISKEKTDIDVGFYETIQLIKNIDYNNLENIYKYLDGFRAGISILQVCLLLTLNMTTLSDQFYEEILKFPIYIKNVIDAIKNEETLKEKYKKQLIELEDLEKQYNLLIKKCEEMNKIFKDEITPIVQVKKLNL